MKKYIALFFTHSGAIKFQRYSKKNNINCELMPVPRKLSSNCGICARFIYQNNINDIVDEEIEKIYELVDDKYNLIYEEH